MRPNLLRYPEERESNAGGGMINNPPRKTEKKALNTNAPDPGPAHNAAGMDSSAAEAAAGKKEE